MLFFHLFFMQCVCVVCVCVCVNSLEFMLRRCKDYIRYQCTRSSQPTKPDEPLNSPVILPVVSKLLHSEFSFEKCFQNAVRIIERK